MIRDKGFVSVVDENVTNEVCKITKKEFGILVLMGPPRPLST